MHPGPGITHHRRTHARLNFNRGLLQSLLPYAELLAYAGLVGTLSGSRAADSFAAPDAHA